MTLMHNLVFRDATIDDVPQIVDMYADDVLGQKREAPSDPPHSDYLKAFAAIEADQRSHLIVAEYNGDIVGTLQLTFISHLVLRGGERAQIEAVRIRQDHRGQGLGESMISWAIERAKFHKCRMVQLTTSSERVDSINFYKKLGFKASHIGMKLDLEI